MKPGALAALGCLGAFALCLAGILALAVVAPLLVAPGEQPAPPPVARRDRPPTPPPPPPTPEPDEYRRWVPSRNAFGREDGGAAWRMRYGFVDHHGKTVDVGCAVDKREHEREVASFGYDQAELNAAVDAALTERVGRELEARGLAPYVDLRFHDGGSYEWRSEIRGITDASEVSRLVAERVRWKAWMEEELPGETRRIEAALYKRHGFLLRRNRLSIDYGPLAVAATPRLSDCAGALEAAASGASERRALGLYLAFFQELKYEVPPDRQGRREILGLWVPTEVLVKGRGDCDSKAVAFCALWRNRGPRAIVITVPGHALVGVEAKPGPGEHFVRLGNRYFVLCEVAGPGKFHPGEQAISGSFQYTEIPPARTRG